ncbi:hypothetical protein E6W17_37185 [Streptomyces sp. A1547]|nr:hypothetical protein E6W17_37185 [Streptomyces sp. A1547]
MAAGARDPSPGGRLFRPGGEVSPSRWAFISDNRADFGVKRICQVLGASRAGYYRHLATEQDRAERRAEEARPVSEIRAIHHEHHGAYGAPRVHAELRARGRRIHRKRVTRLMRVNDIFGRHLRKRRRTTIADRTVPPVPDLVMVAHAQGRGGQGPDLPTDCDTACGVSLGYRGCCRGWLERCCW